MNNLSGFLAQNAIKVENIKYVASKRFLDENTNPIEWEIKAISGKEDEEIRNSCSKKIKTKQGTTVHELDTNKYVGRIVTACTVYPNLLDAKLQDSYGVMGEDELIKVMLNPGEYMSYVSKVQEINGFNISIEELVEEAKN